MSSENPAWNTPVPLIQLCWEVWPEGIGLDPCSNPGSIVKAKVEWSLEAGNDGLAQPWKPHGTIYVNPPYGREILPWCQRMAIEGAAGAEIIALLPSRTDTKWMQEYVQTAQALLFWKGRLTFMGAKDPAPFPSVVAYWGPRLGMFAHCAARRGMVLAR